MKFTKVRDLKYVTADNSLIDILATCQEFGEIPITLNLVDIEGLHVFDDSKGNETSLEVYCKTQTIAPYVEPTPVVDVPQSITMRQTRLQLLEYGLLDEVELLVSIDKKSQIEWEYASSVERQSPLIKVIGVQLKLTDEQLDTMFIKASKL